MFNIYWSRNLLPSPQRNSSARKIGVLGIFHWSHCLPRTVCCLSYSSLSFRVCGEIVQQVCLHCIPECYDLFIMCSIYSALNFFRLDYVGIALLIMGSFFPWLYYGFYCEKSVQIVYLSVTFVLGLTSIIVSLWDRFGEPRFRPLRAGLWLSFN